LFSCAAEDSGIVRFFSYLTTEPGLHATTHALPKEAAPARNGHAGRVNWASDIDFAGTSFSLTSRIDPPGANKKQHGANSNDAAAGWAG
jgi:hypothetical protein